LSRATGLVAFLSVCLFALTVPEAKADIFVPTDYPMIQAAIRSPLPGEAIQLAAGRYSETLSINESLTLAGSGTNKCVLYCLTNIPIVTINGPGTVTSSHLDQCPRLMAYHQLRSQRPILDEPFYHLVKLLLSHPPS
jgi:pectin methylesterase-like acyl-CoA thioesterase